MERRDVIFDECTFKQQNEKEDDFFLLYPTVKNADSHRIVEVSTAVNNSDEEEFLSTGSDFEGFEQESSETNDDAIKQSWQTTHSTIWSKRATMNSKKCIEPHGGDCAPISE